MGVIYCRVCNFSSFHIFIECAKILEQFGDKTKLALNAFMSRQKEKPHEN